MAKKRAKRRVRERDEDRVKPFYSRSYHRYFEGYAEQEIINEKGKRRIKRVYVGKYYMQKADSRQRLLRKALYAGLYLLAWALFIIAGTRNIEMNRAWYVAAPVALSVFLLFWLLLPMFYYLTAPEKMMVRTYRDASENLIRLSLTASVVLGVTAAAALAGVFITPSGPCLPEIISPCLFLAAGVLLFCLWRLEKTAPYTILPPTNNQPDKSVVI